MSVNAPIIDVATDSNSVTEIPSILIFQINGFDIAKFTIVGSIKGIFFLLTVQKRTLILLTGVKS